MHGSQETSSTTKNNTVIYLKQDFFVTPSSKVFIQMFATPLAAAASDTDVNKVVTGGLTKVLGALTPSLER